MAKLLSRGGTPVPLKGVDKQNTQTVLNPNNVVLMIIAPHEARYKHLIHNIIPNVGIKVVSSWKLPPLSQITAQYKRIVTTRQDVLKIVGAQYVLDKSDQKDLSVYTYSGSIIPYDGAEFLILEPLMRLPYDIKYNVLMRQYAYKFTQPDRFPQVKYQPYIYHAGGNTPNKEELLAKLDRAVMTSVDIETIPFVETPDGEVLEHNVITIIGYGMLFPDGSIESHSIQMDSQYAHDVLKAMNAHPIPKVAHGGKYDLIWCLRWGIPIANLTHDTMIEFHSWYHDFRKSLDHVAAFTCKDYVYWKEERKSSGTEQRLLYNCKDVHYTMQALMYLMWHRPEWTKVATHRKIRRAHYNVASCFLGMKVDPVILATETAKYTEETDDILATLRTIVGQEHFNPNSPSQAKMFLQILAGKRLTLKNADAKAIAKVADLDAFSAYMCDILLTYRKRLKTLNSYFHVRLWGDRVLTSIDVCGTTSDRLASRKSDFWHYPDRGKSGKYLKPKEYGWAAMTVQRAGRACVVADDGMMLFSCDLPSAEAYFVWKLSGDPVMGEVLNSDKDYHKTNAHLFFGVPYEDIHDALRDLAKRINHGSNYNMGGVVLIETMGLANILEAQYLLGLDPNLTPLQVALYLLNLFQETYEYIKGSSRVPFQDSWYGSLVKEVAQYGRITTPDGWTKYIMGDPMKDKLVLNNLASVKPQHLSAEYLHQGYDRLWAEYYKPRVFEPLIPIHDESMGQCRADMVDHYSPIIQKAMTLDFNMGDSILRIVPDKPKFGRTWGEIH